MGGMVTLPLMYADSVLGLMRVTAATTYTGCPDRAMSSRSRVRGPWTAITIGYAVPRGSVIPPGYYPVTHMNQEVPMDETMAAALREPFPASAVGKLPRVTCRDCSKSPGRCCNSHKKVQCRDCNNFISERHIHLDYVGHAAVTDRLLAVDPQWSWEPMALDVNGLPLVDRGALWIRLTVGGVTRLGVGEVENKDNPVDGLKGAIGDALRNAAMRFGVAIDLWSKEDLHRDEEPRRDEPVVNEVREQPAPDPGPPVAQQGRVEPLSDYEWIMYHSDRLDDEGRNAMAAFREAHGVKSLKSATPEQLTVMRKYMEKVLAHGPNENLAPTAAATA